MKKLLLVFAIAIAAVSCSEDNSIQSSSTRYRADLIADDTVRLSLFFNGDNRLSLTERCFSENFGKGFPGIFTQVQLDETELPISITYQIASQSDLGACTKIVSNLESFLGAEFEYDAEGYLKKLKSAGYTSEYMHSNGRLISKTVGPQKIEYTYENGLVTSSPAGTVKYDENGYPILITLKDDQLEIVYSDNYNKMSLLHEFYTMKYYFSDGRLIRLDDGFGNTYYSYDAKGRLIKIEEISDGPPRIITIKYTALN